MTNFLLSLVTFIIAISILIAVHEFGHYWVARRMGVKVLRFSIGFGKPLWSRVGKDEDRIEYVISALPLGGYVKMLDEREGEVAEHEVHRAFNRQAVAKRFAIVSAGPLFNLAFAVFAYWLMFMHGIPGLKPVLGAVPADTPAAVAGLHEGNVIVEIDGTPVTSWGEVLETVLPQALLREPVELLVEEDGVRTRHTLRLDHLEAGAEQTRLPELIGFQPYRPVVRPVVDKVVAGSVAERAGLRPGDLLTHVAGQPVPEWRDLVEAISRHPGERIAVELERAGAPQTLELIPEAVQLDDRVVGRIGISPLIPPLPAEMIVELRYGPWLGLQQALGHTWDNSVVTLQMMGQMIAGRVSMENLSGPITIASYARSSAMAGVAEFLRFLAVVSLSLGVLNLLPIPVLDGGHLAFYVVELIKGSPVSERTEMVGQRIGLALILAMMALALYNDLARFVG